MKSEIHLAFCMLLLLPGSSQTTDQGHDLPSVFTTGTFQSPTGTSESPVPVEDPGTEPSQSIGSPAGTAEASTGPTGLVQTEGAVRPDTLTQAGLETHQFPLSSAAAPSQHTPTPIGTTSHPEAPSLIGGLSSPPTPLDAAPQPSSATEGRDLPTSGSPASFSFSSRPIHAVHNRSSTASTSTSTVHSQSAVGSSQALTSGLAPVAPTHREVPSELNVGDEDLKGSRHHSSSPLDPLLAGLLSVFIVTTAVVFVILFLKFRQRTNHPEFHRLQDLPMVKFLNLFV
ncbi:unnamed protein product [Menidia menidia]|uniref:(Atlantic silverside) hypothetical protein n=1 Tax=Menidia menidia TaxID=238744 RepID=A0A8S4AS02_9TELE|nr:unnamed protein product [Menidia menidia]